MENEFSPINHSFSRLILSEKLGLINSGIQLPPGVNTRLSVFEKDIYLHIWSTQNASAMGSEKGCLARLRMKLLIGMNHAAFCLFLDFPKSREKKERGLVTHSMWSGVHLTPDGNWLR